MKVGLVSVPPYELTKFSVNPLYTLYIRIYGLILILNKLYKKFRKNVRYNNHATFRGHFSPYSLRNSQLRKECYCINASSKLALTKLLATL